MDPQFRRLLNQVMDIDDDESLDDATMNILDDNEIHKIDDFKILDKSDIIEMKIPMGKRKKLFILLDKIKDNHKENEKFYGSTSKKTGDALIMCSIPLERTTFKAEPGPELPQCSQTLKTSRSQSSKTKLVPATIQKSAPILKSLSVPTLPSASQNIQPQQTAILTTPNLDEEMVRNSSDIQEYKSHVKAKWPTIYYNKIVSNEKLMKRQYDDILRDMTRIYCNKYTYYPKSYQKTQFAKNILEAFPCFEHMTKIPQKLGAAAPPNFSAIYWADDPEGASGSLDGVLKGLRRKLPPSLKKNTPKRPKKDDDEVQISEKENGFLEELRKIDPMDKNRLSIFNLMEKLYLYRRRLILSEPKLSLDYIIGQIGHICAFNGDFIRNDYEKGFPGDGSFSIFANAIEKINFLVDQWNQIENRTIRAVLNVYTYLNHRGIKKKVFLDNGVSLEEQSAEPFIIWCHTDDEIQVIVDRNKNKLPYLICRSNGPFKDGSYYLILDTNYIDIGQSAADACDLLYKTYQVFNINYPTYFKKTYTFLGAFAYRRDSAKRLVTVRNFISKLEASIEPEPSDNEDSSSSTSSSASSTTTGSSNSIDN